MRVIGITMVRNEQDVIDHVVRHMLNHDLDQVVVADNLSTDDTRDILEAIDDDRLLVLDDLDPAYRQSEKMTALANANANTGDWVIPFDADELWNMPDGRTLSEGLHSAVRSVAAGRLWVHVPQPDLVESGCPFLDMPWRCSVPEVWPKAALCWNVPPRMVIEQGNHWTKGPAPEVLDIRHFQYRSLDHFKTKVTNGAAALALANLPADSGSHWRKFAAMSETELSDWWSDYTGQRLVLDPPECRA